MDMENGWSELPDHVLLQIFRFLKAEDILKLSTVSQTWYRVSRDELLWKSFFKRDWNISPKIGIAPGKTSWFSEYLRLWQHTPILETEVLKGHTHQVLHVSFSHNGKYFATCSKDGYVMLWDAGYPARIKHYYDMKVYSWKNTQFSQFNESDTLLLVSGVHFGNHSNTGEIAVFNLEENFVIQCRMSNKPYDFFGTWYNDNYLLSGDLRWLAHLVSTSIVWLNRASQESDSEFTSIMNRMFKFYNRSASSIRSITVANCRSLPQHQTSSSSPTPSGTSDDCASNKSCHKTGNPISQPELAGTKTVDPGSAKESFQETSEGSLWPINTTDEFQCWRRNSPDVSISGSTSAMDHDIEDDSKSEDNEAGEQSGRSDSPLTSSGTGARSQRAESEATDEDSEEVLDPREKFLIFTMGSRTYTPHQIGLKRITPFTFCNRIDVGPSLAERVAIQRQERQALEESLALGIPPPEPVWQDFEAVADRFDPIDHIIDLNGHIIGMSLSPDHRYLYVNVRPWPQGCTIENPLQPPPIAQEIDIHVIDLVTLKQVGSLLRAHRSFTPNDECFFIFLDVSKDYVASGAEDKYAYIWDRHYGGVLAKLNHLDVVNAVSFNPRDPEVLITASDDYTLKIWRSRHRARQLKLPVEEFPVGMEFRRRCSRLN
ncbi:F-box/WD repeat-containing protein 5-like isoform X1 [Daphnia pulicaria]|uniref:F-box/WD repeat-containing protein 5-like isoform X1 n=1 Tax=Daphnia pulicaria TaxID=35523 RepID=UPI001EEB29BE|nr:F-box/WD repeat-containing protein 5-like isoform X1 [Daphnia pulicaria]